MGRLHYGFARQNQVLCLDAHADQWRIAFGPRTPSHALIETQRVAPCPIDWVFCEDASALEKTINQAYSNQETNAATVASEVAGDLDLAQLLQDIPAVEDLLETEDDAPIIRMINALLTQASRDGASDIHIEAFETHSAVRFRIDGTLVAYAEVPARCIAAAAPIAFCIDFTNQDHGQP